MHDPQRMPIHCALRAATLDDFDFAEALTRNNMGGYYKRHGLSWQGYLFLARWKESENFIVESHHEPIGILRINEEDGALHVRDIQIVASHRGCGAGTFVLHTLHGWARKRQLRTLTLRVFVDNPAVLLYERLGYRLIGSTGQEFASIRRMECIVG
jgi:GNAT superfamily N-acetyltransferase